MMASHNLIKTLSEFAWIMLSMGCIMYLAQLAPLWHKKFYTKVEERHCYAKSTNIFIIGVLSGLPTSREEIRPKSLWEQKDEKEGTLCHPWHLFPWLMEGFKKDEITERRKIKPNHSLG